jgi:hypothetical protein
MYDACCLQQAPIRAVRAMQGLQLGEKRKGPSGRLTAMGFVEPIRAPQGEEGPLRLVCLRDAIVRERDRAAHSSRFNFPGIDAGHSTSDSTQ